mgnify:CR=1 FL=1
MLYVFSRNGWPAIPGYEADPLLRSFLQGANRHLKGTAMRIRPCNCWMRQGCRATLWPCCGKVWIFSAFWAIRTP